jgi:sugar-specific transcriptional regulator TrmB
LVSPLSTLQFRRAEVVERVKKNVRKDADESVKRLENLKNTDVLQELSSLHSQGVELIEPSELSGSLRGRHNLYNHLEMTIKSAEKSVIIMTTEQGFVRKIEALAPTFEELAKRGVKIKIAAPLTKEADKSLKEISKFAEIRNSTTKARFVVVDSSEVIFMVTNDTEVHPTYDIGIWVNTPFFASSLAELFELAWKEMKPLEAKI